MCRIFRLFVLFVAACSFLVTGCGPRYAGIDLGVLLRDPQISIESAKRRLTAACAAQKRDATADYERRLDRLKGTLGTLDRNPAAVTRERERAGAVYRERIAAIERGCARAERNLVRRLAARKRKRIRRIGAAADAPKRAETLSLREATGDLERDCVFQEREAWRDFHERRRRITRSLNALERSVASQNRRVAEARAALQARLDEIDDSCREMKSTLGRAFERRRTYERRRREARVRRPAGAPLFHSLRVNGRLRGESAVRLAGDRDVTELNSQLLVEQSFRGGSRFRFRLTQLASYDAAFDVNDDYPSEVREDEREQFELRETHVDASIGRFDVRLGKQQVVWGEALASFVADVVNARDLREFILDEFDLIRIPQWGVNVTASAGPIFVEGVALLPEMNRLPEPGAEFAVPQPVPPGIPVVAADPSEPSRTLENAEFGGRASMFAGGWDMSAFALRTWDKNPVPYRTFTGFSYVFRPRYERENVFGGAFSKDVSGVIFKGELAVRPRHHLAVASPLEADGVVRRQTVDYLLGFDKSIGRVDAAVQFTERIVQNAPDGLAAERPRRRIATIWARLNLFRDRVQPLYLLSVDTDRSDRLHQPRMDIRLTDQLTLAVGADIFEGDVKAGALFGLFDNRDRAWTQIDWYF